ncbi:hypothetical protein CIHG_05480 [Coccidioides immitis H538.4]|uniref:Uncharacterized protein n=1 Tax=Coccidioides immitis H538.4 TaxID=396776 RepID=A0A0J8UJR9_COCIT|nr:hypothetical protein CIHG_05480 [Coccidioides immitis H538.4]
MASWISVRLKVNYRIPAQSASRQKGRLNLFSIIALFMKHPMLTAASRGCNAYPQLSLHQIYDRPRVRRFTLGEYPTGMIEESKKQMKLFRPSRSGSVEDDFERRLLASMVGNGPVA